MWIIVFALNSLPFFAGGKITGMKAAHHLLLILPYAWLSTAQTTTTTVNCASLLRLSRLGPAECRAIPTDRPLLCRLQAAVRFRQPMRQE